MHTKHSTQLKTIAIAPSTNFKDKEFSNPDLDTLYKILQAYSSLPFEKETSTKFGRIQPVSEGMYEHFINALHCKFSSKEVFSRIQTIKEGTDTLVLSYEEFVEHLKSYRDANTETQLKLIERLSEVSEELGYLKDFEPLLALHEKE